MLLWVISRGNPVNGLRGADSGPFVAQLLKLAVFCTGLNAGGTALPDEGSYARSSGEPLRLPSCRSNLDAALSSKPELAGTSAKLID